MKSMGMGMDEAKARERREARRKILFGRDSGCLQELLGLMEAASHRALVLWAQDCVASTLAAFEAACPGEARPRIALERCAAWARGEIKMTEAKRAILDAHAVAKEVDDRRILALAHAIGHAGATVHVKTHAPGLAFYELTAIRLEACADWEEAVARRIGIYTQRLMYWSEHADDPGRAWAEFLRDE